MSTLSEVNRALKLEVKRLRNRNRELKVEVEELRNKLVQLNSAHIETHSLYLEESER